MDVSYLVFYLYEKKGTATLFKELLHRRIKLTTPVFSKIKKYNKEGKKKQMNKYAKIFV